jgi:hypothetical protein
MFPTEKLIDLHHCRPSPRVPQTPRPPMVRLRSLNPDYASFLVLGRLHLALVLLGLRVLFVFWQARLPPRLNLHLTLPRIPQTLCLCPAFLDLLLHHASVYLLERFSKTSDDLLLNLNRLPTGCTVKSAI